MRFSRSLFSFLLVLSLIIPTFVSATDFSSSNFKVKDPVLEELGGFSSSSHFGLRGSIPFISPRPGTSTSFGNLPGFLSFQVTTTATSSGGGGGGGGGGGSSGGGGGIVYPPGTQPEKPRPKPSEKALQFVDFNKDGFVNFVDFSILLYYFDKPGGPTVVEDLNSDGVVDLVDLSIFMYYWNGEDAQPVAPAQKI
jgi:hypothetical protein